MASPSPLPARRVSLRHMRLHFFFASRRHYESGGVSWIAKVRRLPEQYISFYELCIELVGDRQFSFGVVMADRQRSESWSRTSR